MGRPPLPRDTPNCDMIEAYRDHLEAGGRSPVTIESKLSLLYRLDRELVQIQLAAGDDPLGLAGALKGELERWLRKFRSVHAKATYRAHIVMFYDWATDETDQWLSYNPALRLPRPAVRRGIPNPVSDDIVRLCVTQAAQPWRLHCILAAYAGLRPIEIATIRRENFTSTYLHVVGKGNKPAVLPTEPPVWRAVRDLPAGPVSRQLNGLPATRQWVSAETARYLRTGLGVEATLKRFRQWHGTWLRRHFDLRIVQERMRHESLATTQIYTAVTNAELYGSVGALPDFTADDDGSGGAAPGDQAA